MEGDNPFGASGYDTPKSEFNVALATAFYTHNLRIGINKAIWENNIDAASDLLSSLSCEIEGYYMSKPKKKTEDIVDKLKTHERKNKTIINSSAENKKTMLKEQVKEWRSYLIMIAHVIWFSQEKTNIYGDDYD